MERSGTYERLGKRYSRGLGLILLVLVLVVSAFWWWRGQTPSFISHLSVAVIGDPIQIWTWDRHAQTFVLLLVPSSTRIDTVGGYGRYSVDALWRLDALDKLGGTLFLESAEDALGLPIRRFIAPQLYGSNRLDNFADMRSIFSLTNVFPLIFGRWKTNLSLFEFLGFAQALQFTRVDAVRMIDLGKSTAIDREALPDGTTQKFLDRDRLDVALGRAYEDTMIRSEGLSVGVFNTTKTPTLGERAARLLSRIGVLVVSVGNDESRVNGCLLRGKKAALGSVTAKQIAYYFDCAPKEGESERVDLMLLLGRAYEKRFIGRNIE